MTCRLVDSGLAEFMALRLHWPTDLKPSESNVSLPTVLPCQLAGISASKIFLNPKNSTNFLARERTFRYNF
jgi:hypothetical protein